MAAALLLVVQVSEANAPKLARASLSPAGVEAKTLLQLDSLPRGAGVYLGGERVCVATPCAVTLAACAAGTRLHFRFALPAHDDFVLSKTVPREVDGGQGGRALEVYARLD